MNLPMRPLGDRVLVVLPPKNEEQVTAAGLVLVKDPDVLRTETRGIVVALGEKPGTVDIDEVLAVVREYQGSEDFIGAEAIFTALKALAPASFDVAVGDCVLFPPTAGDPFEYDGQRFVILHESELIGVVEPDTASEEAA